MEMAAGMISVAALVSAAAFAASVYFYIRKFFQPKVANERLEELAYRDELLKTQERMDQGFLNSSLVKSNRHMMTIPWTAI